MATIGKTGGSKQVGAVKVRPQVYDATAGRLSKAGAATGQIVEVKTGDQPLARVRRTKAVKKRAVAIKKASAGKTAKKTAKQKQSKTPAKR